MENSHHLPPSVRLVTGRGGLPRLDVVTPLAEAHVYLHGAHVAHYARAGRAPVLFESARAWFEPGKPIRGGVPVIFPWFGPHADGSAMPAHGFARTRGWELESAAEENGEVILVLLLGPDETAQTLWPEGGDAWSLRHRIRVGETLTMDLEISNGGVAPIRLEEALHTYFKVSDVRQIEVQGLEKTEYVTRIEDLPRKRQGSEPIRFTGETDRVYVNTEAALTIVDPGLGRRIRIGKEGSRSTVIWNPWVNKSLTMNDFLPDEWPGMVCVETGNVGENSLQIPAGGRHLSRTVIREEEL